MFILAGAGPRPDAQNTMTVTHVYRNVQSALGFGQPGVLNPLSVAYLTRKTHDALDFGRPGVQNSITVAQLCRSLHNAFGFGQISMPARISKKTPKDVHFLLILAGGWPLPGAGQDNQQKKHQKLFLFCLSWPGPGRGRMRKTPYLSHICTEMCRLPWVLGNRVR